MEKISEYLDAHDEIVSSEAQIFLGVNPQQTRKILAELVEEGKIKYVGGVKQGCNVKYTKKNS